MTFVDSTDSAASSWTSWTSLVAGMRALQESLDRALQASSQITQSYLEILKALSDAEGRRLRMSELAEVTRSSRSRLSHAVGRLQERGYVDRVGFEADRRGQVAQLTTAGLDLVNRAVPAYAEAVRSQLLDRLTPLQLAILGELGDVLLDASGAPSSEHPNPHRLTAAR